MDDPQRYTAAQAADPSTPGEVLAAIAGSRPDLRAHLATNPATYPALLEWLGALGDPAVDAALRARRGGGDSEPGSYVPPAAAQGWSWSAPAGGPATAAGPPAAGPTAGGGEAPEPGAGHPGGLDTPTETAAQGQPGAPGYGQPGAPGVPGYGAPEYGAPGYGQQGAPGYGPSGAAPYAAPPPGTRPSGSRTWLWILLGLLGLLLVGGVVVGVVVFQAIDRAADELGTAFDTGQARSYGDDPALDALWDSCEAGDMAACDELYRQSPPDSAYEDFADTCGRRTQGGTWCEDLGDAQAPAEEGRRTATRSA